VKPPLGNRIRTGFYGGVFLSLGFLLGLSGCNNSYTPPPDTTPPSAPAGLTTTVISDTQINLSWTASTDNVGVTGYKVERCQGTGCSSFTQIATPAATTFNDTGLTPSTSYSYRVRATDAAGNLSNYSGTASTTTQAPAPVSVSISPKRAAVTTGQIQTFSATVSGSSNTSVTWAVDTIPNGNAAVGTIDTNGKYTPPSTAGAHTITATSAADITKSATAPIGVTDLPGVYTFHNDISRTGANLKEYALTTALTSPFSPISSSTFGKLFSCKADAAIYAQPLWVASLMIGGALHNVIFVATERDTVYAFDADANPCMTYWQTGATGVNSLLPSGETWVTSNDVSCNDLAPDIGITSTPVIDPVTNTIYVLTKSKVSSTGTMHQRLHALNLVTGAEKFGGPMEIQATVAGNGDGSSGNPRMVSFDPSFNGQRPALLLENGHVVISWASHCDNSPYHGWVMSYSASTLSREAVFNTSPNNGGLAGVWMSGNGPAADASGNIYFATGNGVWDGVTDFGDSIVKLGPPSGGSFTAANFDYFTPINQASLNGVDEDLGSGGLLLLPDLPSGPNPRLLVQAGKEGKIYLINRDTGSMGQFCTACTTGDTQIVQELPNAVGGMWDSPTYWNGNLFFGGAGDSLKAFSFNAGSSGVLSLAPTSQTNAGFGFPGTTPSVSASGSTNGILWAIDTNSCGPLNNCSAGGPAILHAYDATNLNTELWNSSGVAADKAGNAVKFTVPTIANGKVYIGTRGSDTGGGGAGELDVYGLKPN
jgi:chitodextrinase